MNKELFKGFIVADFTADSLKDIMASSSDYPAFEITSAPFNQVSQVLLQKVDIAKGGYDFLLIWTRPETILPSISSSMQFRDVKASEVLDEVDSFCNLIKLSLNSVAVSEIYHSRLKYILAKLIND